MLLHRDRETFYKIGADLKGCVLILGFFDGIHLGHRAVIKSAVEYAKQKGQKSVLLTFKASPAEYFGKAVKYIYPREYSYRLIETLGGDCIIEDDFSDLADIEAEDYIRENLVKPFSPCAIFTGYNYSFGAQKKGSSDMLEKFGRELSYEYYKINPYKINDTVVSSTKIKEFLSEGNIEQANEMLYENFVISGQVIEGKKFGRTIGFPTANIIYPDSIVRLPYGVYKVFVNNKPAVLNWGVKPTVNGEFEGLEVHIPGFSGDLYGREITLKFAQKIRDEKKFDGIDTLAAQIKKDISVCLE